MKHTILLLILAFSIFQCAQKKTTLPILGNKEIINEDTIFHTIPEFSFINQDSIIINNDTYADKIYIADFFFTSCITICPKVKAQMLRIAEKYKDNPKVKLLSHSIDTRHDSVPRLHSYAQKLGINSEQWSLVTGVKEEIYDIADDYFSVAIEDESVPGGYDHSGRLILVDEQGHIRSFCDGTIEEEVNQFMEDIDILLAERSQK